jgi:hypothetical protein
MAVSCPATALSSLAMESGIPDESAGLVGLLGCPVGDRATVCPPGSSALQEPQIDRTKYQDNSDVCYQPLYEVVPEEQDVHADHDGYQREHIEHDGCGSHRFVLLSVAGVEQGRHWLEARSLPVEG